MIRDKDDEPRGCLVRCACARRYTYPEYVALPLEREEVHEAHGESDRVHVRLCSSPGCGRELRCLVASSDGAPEGLYYHNAMWADAEYQREERERHESET